MNKIKSSLFNCFNNTVKQILLVTAFCMCHLFLHAGAAFTPALNDSTKSYDKLLNSALSLQIKVDSILRLVNKKTEHINDILDQGKREQLKAELHKLKMYANTLQDKVDKKYMQVRQLEDNRTPKTVQDTIVLGEDTTIDDIKVYKYLYTEDTTKRKKSNSKTKEETTPCKQQYKEINFKIFSSPQYTKDNPIPFNQDIPGGLTYRIQLGVFSEKVSPEKFKGLYPVSGETLKNDLIKYYVGFFNTYTEATKALEKVKNIDFHDAYIVSYYEGKKISVDKAKTYEKK